MKCYELRYFILCLRTQMQVVCRSNLLHFCTQEKEVVILNQVILPNACADAEKLVMMMEDVCSPALVACKLIHL